MFISYAQCNVMYGSANQLLPPSQYLRTAICEHGMTTRGDQGHFPSPNAEENVSAATLMRGENGQSRRYENGTDSTMHCSFALLLRGAYAIL